MDKLIEKVENLKKELDNQENIKKIKELNNKIFLDKELISLIEKYKLTQNEEIKKEIISNKLYKEYKEIETDINILILSINQKLKKITKKGKCSI